MMNTLTPSLKRKPLISNPVFGAMVVTFVDLMFFAALMSSYFVLKRGREIWSVTSAVQLPVMASGFNAFVLLLSGASLILAARASRDQGHDAADARGHLFRALVLGVCFAAYQIVLGAKLVSAGFTLRSSIFAGSYFLIVGIHVLHVAFGVLAMMKLYFRPGTLSHDFSTNLKALCIFWVFVVAIWPVLYAQLYL